MCEKSVWLVAGLGNPGERYRDTRHNTGFMVIDQLSDRFSISVTKNRFDALFGSGRINEVPVILVKPMSFMNLSGTPIKRIADYYGINSKSMLIIHDDIDLTFGRIQIKEKGGHGGHKGLKSIMEAFGEGDFVRLRIGIGRSEHGHTVSDYVLANFMEDEKKSLEHIIGIAREAVTTVLCKGTKESMNLFNRKESLN